VIPPAPPYPIATDTVTVEIRAERDSDGGRLVLMDGVEASHVDLLDPTRIAFEYLRQVVRLLEASFEAAQRLDLLQIGGGPCTLARYLVATRPGARVTVVERDAGLIRVAREWLGLEESSRLKVIAGEGRAELARRPDACLDAVVVDAFEGIVVPHSLLTTEFADEVRRALRPGGLHLVNLIDIPPLEMTTQAAAGLVSRYADVALIADERVWRHRSSGNVVLAASDRTLPVEAPAREAGREAAPWRVRRGRELRRMIEGAPALHDGTAPQHGLARMSPLFGRAPARAADPQRSRDEGEP